MKLFTTKQIADLDKYTIDNEPITDIDLMERASMQMTNWMIQNFSTEHRLLFFAGPGNNGGDALAMARQLADFNYQCEVYLLDFGKDLKGAPQINRNRLKEQNKVTLTTLKSINDFPQLTENDILVDGLLGSGLSRALEGLAGDLVKKINQQLNVVVSVDIPSGLMGEANEDNIEDHIIRADFTLTLQFPKISFLFAENEQFVGQWEVLPISLHPDGILKTQSPYFFLEPYDVIQRLPLRSKFEHKGSLGHALLIAGSYGKMGAAVLASNACLRAGVGLLTTHVPHMGYSIIQTAVPEAMVSIDQHDSMFTSFPNLEPFSAIGVGPGLGQKQNSQRALCDLLEQSAVPLVLDADALNILSGNKNWLEKLPDGCILTPHPGEFRRLVGETQSSFEAIKQQMAFAVQYRCTVVLKGACTSIATPEGELFWNSTGNPGMATAGSGDALTGIILGLLALGMPSVDAAIAGVYMHGMAGDIASNALSEFALTAGDIINNLGKAFLKITS
ncbi:NAD(P)H-hydrate dehydratase [uncultured Draconibacterium sp.]|uniref:NAD(P)H-hydrate dehydratase n=1 Tax=uncultured Draconibacterium sp. TaxID=1573823 RepID=UPI003260D2B8